MLKSRSSRLHPEFDLDQATRTYAASAASSRGEMVTSPHDLYSMEALRDKHDLRKGRAVPTDVFVFGKGEAPRRDGTKVGGLPYWPVGRPWPMTEAGIPYRFLAQFNFADSRDLLSGLHGDVLLLLVQPGDDWFFEDDQIHFEWLPLGLAPVTSFEPSWIVNQQSTFFGAIHRTTDYPDAAELAERAGIRRERQVAILNGAKIGGLPHVIQQIDLGGEFICQLNSIQAAPNAPYPWVNDPAPLDLNFGDRSIYGDANQFVFLDMGNIYIFRAQDGTLRSHCDSY